MIGVLAALEHRRQTGQGQKVEVDLFTCTISAQQQELTYYLNHGSIPERPVENHGSVWATAPFGLYETADGDIAIAMTPCPVLADALDLPDLAQYDTLDKMVESPRGDLRAPRGALARTGTHRALDRDPARARRVVRRRSRTTTIWSRIRRSRTTACGGTCRSATTRRTFRTPASPFVFSATPVAIHRGVPDLGEHTEEIFGKEDG